MRLSLVFRFGLLGFLVQGLWPAQAGNSVIDCGHRSLAAAVRENEGEGVLVFTGVCTGPVVIQKDGLSLRGTGTAIIDGAGSDAITIAGVHNIQLSNFEVRNGLSGIVAVNGAHFNLNNVNVHDNALFGVTLQTAASVVAKGVSIKNSGIHGLDLETGSAATLQGTFTSSNNRVFGINVNGSSITFSLATVTASGNALGMQVATNANAFLNDPATVLNFTGNLATGLTVVSGGHLVSFGGTINSTQNGLDGVSVNSKGGLDLDAGSILTSANNGGDGVLLQEASVMTVFNIPQFSGASGFSTVDTHNNLGSGLSVKQNSTFTVSNQAKLLSSNNQQNGLFADNGGTVTLVNSIVTNNIVKDLQLKFGSRADLPSVTYGTYTCDATVLARGSGVSCPH